MYRYVEYILPREKLHSQSYQAAYQQVIKNLSNYIAIIVWKKNFGWQLSCVLEIVEKEEIKEYFQGCLGIDLGIKRIATTFDGTDSTTYSGKTVPSFVPLLIQQLNKPAVLGLF